MSLLDRLMIVVVLAAAAWWVLSRDRRPAALQALSVVAVALAAAVALVEGLRWQLVPWQGVAVAVVAAAALRRWRPGYLGRWRRIMGPAVQRLIDIRTADSSFVLDQLSRLANLAPHSPVAGHLDLHHVGIVGLAIGGATAVQVMASDGRFKVGVNLDGKLFGAEPGTRLDRPFLWVQSGTAPTAEYANGRDRFFGGLRGGGALVTIRGSIHTSFTDGPSYLTGLGRSLVGGASIGSISTADMTAMTGDMISAFVGPTLGVTNGTSLEEVIARYSAIRSDRRIAPKPS